MLGLRYVAGLALAFCIGAACGLCGVPVPAPPAIGGAMLVVSMTLGYEVADRLVARSTGATPAAGADSDRSHEPSDRSR